jgi:hypothetical protein
MDLAGRRIEQEFNERRLPELVEKIKGYCPDADIAVSVDWESFEDDHAALENLWLVFEQPSFALEQVCKDDLGRQAVAESVHRIVIRNVPAADKVGATFAGGTLTVAMLCAEGASGTPGWPEIEKVVSANL